MKNTLIILASAAALAGCGTMSNQDQGSLIGAVAGGIIGNQVGQGSGRVVATGIGAILGAMVGSNIGRTMDEHDRRKMNTILERSPSNVTNGWVNPDTNRRYEMTPRPAYNKNGKDCRDYVVTGFIDGKRENITGTACRQPNGEWRAVN